ncbi:MAG TPA: hypothetical protein VKT80_05100 [Chloroflexota bacterium]|nr:hypothetical protein [Chloroflexota bacterium]
MSPINVGDVLWHPRQHDVTVLQVSAMLVELETSEGKTFWAPKTSVVELRGEGREAEFVKALLASRYCLRAQAHCGSEAEFAKMEYEEWCGEEFPTECFLRNQDRRNPHHEGTALSATWRLFYPLGETPPAPFRIIPPPGYTKIPGRTDVEHGIIRLEQNRVEVYFKSIISRLVKIGLRARKSYQEAV